MEQFNTGRQYGREGQLIVWCWVSLDGQDHVWFSDETRSISGIVEVDKFNCFGDERDKREVQGSLLAYYDAGNYFHADYSAQDYKFNELIKEATALYVTAMWKYDNGAKK